MTGPATLSQGRALAKRLSADRQPDPRLPLLLNLLDAQGLRAFWASRPELVKAAQPDELATVEVLRYRPGRRCALQVRSRQESSPSFFIKLFHGGRAGRARRVGKVLRRLQRQGPWTDLRLPRLLDCVEDEGLIVLSEVAGRPWEALLADRSASARTAEDAGRALARLHTLAPLRMHRWSAERELEAMNRNLRSLAADEHSLAPRLAAGVDRIGGALHEMEELDFVPLHRDLHPQQVLLGDSGAGFVDLDDAAAGPPEIDAGNLLAHLDLIAALDASSRPMLLEQERAFLEGHATGSVRIERAALPLARAATLLRLAGIHAGRDDGGALASALLNAAESRLREGLGS